MLNKDLYNQDEYADYYAQEVRGAEISDSEDGGSGKKIVLIFLLLLLIIAVGYFGWKNMNSSDNTISKGDVVSVTKESKVEEKPVEKAESEPPVSMPEQSDKLTAVESPQEDTKEPTKADTITTAVESIASQNGKNTKMNSDDIANIVQMVMMKMNEDKNKELKSSSSKGTTESKSEQEDTSLVESLTGTEVDSLSSITDKKGSTLSKDTDTYNKVVLKSSSSSDGLDDLSKLSAELSDVIDSTDTEDTTEDTDSNYAKSITKEVKTREKEMRYIVVKKGDTLGKIAKRVYGNVMDYKKIYEANPDVLRRPDKIYIGQKLRIP